MTVLTKKTAKLLCARSGIARTEMTEEAQKLFALCNDPNVAPEQKEVAIRELDELIRRLEEKVQTTRRVRGDSAPGNP
jgi:hypothetical protein